MSRKNHAVDRQLTGFTVIEGYFRRESIVVGEPLHIHVSTDSAHFRIDFYRIGAEVCFAGSTGWLRGLLAPAPAHPDGVSGHASPGVDWNWPAHEFVPPTHWRPGAYVAFMVEFGQQIYAIDPLEGYQRAFFVLRPQTQGVSSILYKVSTFTRHAYNRSDGPGLDRASSLYDHPVYRPKRAREPVGHIVNMHRPGRLTDFAYWDAPFIGWLERSGYQVEFCTDLDLHLNPDLLAPHQLLLSVGHDEYWTSTMRDRVERFIRSGQNVAFFSANTCWWRMHVTAGDTALVSDTDHKVGSTFPHLPATDQWWAPPPDGVGIPENTMTGVSFRNGGMWPSEGPWPGDRPRAGFRVQHADHWVYAGTGLRDGSDGGPVDWLGAGLPLIGYECDGAAFRYDERGVARPTGVDGTPENFQILGIAELWPVHEGFHQPRLGHWNCTSREPDVIGPRAATMGVYTRNGTVFTAATTDWPVIVGQYRAPAVERITRNVLDRLSGGTSPLKVVP